MHKEQLLAAVPPVPVRSLLELYAIAVVLAERAAQRYGALAARTDESFWPVRCVFEVLTAREFDRIESLIAACAKVCGRPPTAADRRWVPPDLVPPDEMADIGDSGLSTPYTAWTLAVRHRQRAFAFWTYIVALAKVPAVRSTAEDFAKEALWDGNLLRRERRLAWRQERDAGETAARPEAEEPTSAALLESLLFKDIVAWSQKLPPDERAQLLALDPFHPPEAALAEMRGSGTGPQEVTEIGSIRRRALQRAEQLSNLYLHDADNAADQASMELAQTLAARSIMRLAGLRHMDSADRRPA